MNGLFALLAHGRLGGMLSGRSSLPGLLGLALPMALLTTADPGIWGRFGIVLVVAAIAHLVFARVRTLPIDFSFVAVAALIAIAVPAGAPLYQLVLGTLFGVIIGEQVFGGRGRSFLNPAAVAVAFLAFSFTDQNYRGGPELAVWALLPALGLLVASGQASWRLLAGAAATVALVGLLKGEGDVLAPMLNGGVVLVVLYIGADPAASAATNPGRWLHGAMIGLLLALFFDAGPAFGAAVFAALLGAIFAPMIDRMVIAVHTKWRERRHG